MKLSAVRVHVFGASLVTSILALPPLTHAEETPSTEPSSEPAAQMETPIADSPAAATPEPAPEVDAIASEPVPLSAAEPSLPPEFGPTKKGDTIMSIAKQLENPGTVTAEQIGWALYQANPKAFAKGDITRVKAGQTFMVPQLAVIQAMAHDAAAAEIEKRIKESRNRPPPKPKDPVVAKLESDLAETKRDSEETAKEQALLKRRLKEIEKEIQELLRANAERDAALRRQASNTKQ